MNRQAKPGLPLQLLEQLEHRWPGPTRRAPRSARRRSAAADSGPAPGRCRPAAADRRTARAGSGCASARGQLDLVEQRLDPVGQVLALGDTLRSSSGSPIDSPIGSRGFSDEPGSWNTMLTPAAERPAAWVFGDLDHVGARAPAPSPSTNGSSPTKRPADGGLAGPGLADQPDDLAAPDLEVEVVHRPERRGAPRRGYSTATPTRSTTRSVPRPRVLARLRRSTVSIGRRTDARLAVDGTAGDAAVVSAAPSAPSPSAARRSIPAGFGDGRVEMFGDVDALLGDDRARGAAPRSAAGSCTDAAGRGRSPTAVPRLDQLAVLHHQHPVGHVGDHPHVVGDQDDRRRRCGP